MHRTLGIFLLVLCLQGCAESTEPIRQVHTSFSESSGLIVTDSSGKSQRLIKESIGVRAVVSPSGEWIVVEDMQFSNLVVIRAFHHTQSGYQEVLLPEITRQWQAFARNAGSSLEDLMHARVGIEEFGPLENTVRLRFQADGEPAGSPDLVSVIEIKLDQGGE